MRAQHFLIRKIVSGAAKRQPQCDLRAPITLSILVRLESALPKVCSSVYEADMFLAMFRLMFHGFLRVGEVTQSPNNIQCHQLDMLPQELHLTFTHFKHYAGPPIVIVIKTRSAACPVAALSSYLKIRGSQQGPLFAYPNLIPVTVNAFHRIFKATLDMCQLSSSIYKPHSFRIGAATLAFQNGASGEVIQRMGRWKSDAFQKYIRVNQLSL